MPYKAFISYSHAADGQLAPTLQSALHRFAKPFYKLRAVRVFRDKSNLQLTPGLWPLIQSVLRESEYFLLLASPDAAKSPWVKSEVEEWLHLNNESLDKFLIILTDGEISWNDSGNDFDWQVTTALPPNLRGKFQKEPLYSDLRWAKKSTDLSLRNPQFLDEIGTIGSTLHGKAKDELVGNDVRQHRVFKVVSGVVTVLLLSLAVAASAGAYYANQQRNEAVKQTGVAVKQTDEARRQKTEADQQRQAAVESAERERTARDREEQQRLKAEKSATQEKLARENETKQRLKAEQATENEKRARLLAEERRKEAERQSKIAFSRELASNANSQLNVDPEVSALLATEAVNVSRTEQAEEALRQAVFESRIKAVLHISEIGPANPFGRPEYVYDAVFSHDGKYIVTASGDTTPRVWDSRTGKLVAKLEGHTGSIWHAEFSPNDKLVLTVGDFTARLWQAQTGKQLRIMKHLEERTSDEREYIRDASFSPDGRYVLTAGQDETARIWETDTGRSVAVMRGHTEDLVSAAFSPDGKYVVTTSWDTTARVFEALTGRPVSVLRGHTERLWNAAFSRDGKLVVTCSNDKTARIWEPDTGREVAQLRGHAGAVLDAVFSPRGPFVLTAGEDGTARIWEATTGKVLAELRGHTAAVSKATFSRDGNYIVTAGTDGTARVWQASIPLKSEEEEQIDTDALMATVRQTRWRNLGVLRGHSRALLSATFSPDGEYIATASADGTARVWEANFPQNLEQLHGPASKVVVASFSPNGEYLATRDEDHHVRVWDVHTGRNLALLHEGDEAHGKVAFSPNSRFLVTETLGSHVWETGTWKNVFYRERSDITGFSFDERYALNGTSVVETNNWQEVFHVPENEARFTPGGKFIVGTSKGGKTRVWEVGTWQLVTESSIDPASFSPDGELFLTSASREQQGAQVWETRTGRKVAELAEGGKVWSPDGKLIVSMKEGREVRVWEARTGRQVSELGEYGDVKESDRDKLRVNSVAFSPDSKFLVTASDDTTARVWDAGTGKELTVLRHPTDVDSAAFSPEGELIVTVAGHTLRVWETATGRSVATYLNEQESAESAVFSPDSRFILTNPDDYGTEVYACDRCFSLAELLELAQTHVTRELTLTEREKYLHQVPEK